MNRHSPTRYLPPPRVPPEEPSSKRRRMERTGQVEMEHLLMELIHCDGGRFDSERTTYSDHSPECALVDDSSGTLGGPWG